MFKYVYIDGDDIKAKNKAQSIRVAMKLCCGEDDPTLHPVEKLILVMGLHESAKKTGDDLIVRISGERMEFYTPMARDAMNEIENELP